MNGTLPIRLIAADLDGTLLNQNFELSPNVRKCVQLAQKAGIKVVVTTGRDLNSTRTFLQELATEQFAITSGGALTWIDGQIVNKKSFTNEQTNRILEFGDQYNTGFFVDQPMITWKFGNPYYIEMYEHISTATYLDQAEPVFDPSPIKISLIQERTNLLQLRQQLNLAYHELNTVFPFEHVLDVNPLGANKGVALTWLADRLGIPISNVAAVGDSENDISMFQAAGFSFAMGNAPEYVRQIASHIVPGNDQDGVAYAIEMILNGGHH